MFNIFEKGEVIDDRDAHPLDSGNFIDHKGIIERNPEWFEPVEEEFKEGDWVYDGEFGGTVFRIVRFEDEDNSIIATGFNYDGVWVEEHPMCNINDESLRKATKDEIEQALIKEAKRRYNIGDKVQFLDGRQSEIKGFSGWKYNEDNDSLTGTDTINGRRDAIYQKGEWAGIIDEPITINGYEVEFKDTYIKVGCRTIPNIDIKDLSSFARRNELSIHREGEDITEAIHKIAERL